MRSIIINGGGLGNVLHVIPLARVIEHLLEEPPDLACNAKWHGAFDDQPFIGRVRVGCGPSEYPASIKCSLAGSRLSFVDAADSERKLAMFYPVNQYTRHETQADMDVARILGWKEDIPSHLLEMPASCECPEIPEPFIGVATRSAEARGWDRKNWPDEHWKELSGLLPAVPVFFGPKSSSREWMTDYGIDLCGRTTIKEARNAIWRASVFVGPDCGLSHLAACCGVPSVALFGATSLTKNRPSGDKVRVMRADLPCLECQADHKRWNACKDWKCMIDIRPKDVLAEVEAQMAT